MEVDSDIERMGMEEEPRIFEGSYESVFDSVSDAILIIDPTGYKVIRANKAALQQLKMDESEVMGKTCYRVRYGRSSVCEPPDHACPIRELMETNTGVTVEHVYYHGDGDYFHVEVSASPVRDDKGNIIHVLHVSRDITKRKHMEEALSHERDLIQTLFEHHPDFIYFKDEKARFHRVSQRFCDFLRRDTDEIIGKTDLDLFPEEIAPQTHREDLEIIKTGKPLINKEEHAGGIWVLTTKMPWYDEEGKIIGLFGISREITERKEVEAERDSLLHDYAERVKELKCLYRISELVETPETSLEETLTKFANLLPPAWHYPDATCARVTYRDQSYPTDNYKETPWRLRANIRVNGETAGMIEVHYLEKMPESHEGPFLREERNLIDDLAGKLGNYIERSEADLKLRKIVKELSERDEALRLLENPLLEVADSVVALPLIGVIDSRRASTMMESLLNHVAERDAELVILDMTGILSVDTATAQHVMQTIEAVRLMGSDAVLTGIRPDVAVTLAALGVELAGTRTFSTLKEGIKHALKEG